MKKTLIYILTFTFVASVSSNAFAETNDGTGNTSITVDGIYQAASSEIISVDIAWDVMDFTYTEAGDIWNPDTHSYSSRDDAAWTWNGATENQDNPMITVTNHSNISVKAAFEFIADVEGVTGSFEGLTDGAVTLDTAVDTKPDEAPGKAVSFCIDGGQINENTSLGTITVNVTKNAEDSGDSGDSDGVIKVSTEEKLHEVLYDLQYEEGTPTVQLVNDITLNNDMQISGQYSEGAVIDLNGYTINISKELALEKRNILSIGLFESPITIKNGILNMERPILPTNTYPSDCLVFFRTTAIFEDCTFYSDKAGMVYLNDSTVTFRNCTFNFDLINNGGFVTFADYSSYSNIIFSGNTRIGHPSFVRTQQGPALPTVTYLAGTYDFNPKQYVNDKYFTVTDLDKLIVTKDGDIWTVTK